MNNKTLAVITFPLLYFTLAISLSHADAYLDMLENEAQSLVVDTATLETASKTYKPNNKATRLIPTTIPAHLEARDFKIYLMDNLYETYLQFNELDYVKKQRVHKQYMEMDLPNNNNIKMFIKNNS